MTTPSTYGAPPVLLIIAPGQAWERGKSSMS